MKKIKPIIAIILLIFFFGNIKVFSQPKTATTEEEYNYVTKGYKVQIEAGLI
jgi:preprotein translocase subunit YajC